MTRLMTVRIGEMLVTIAGGDDVHRFDVRIVQREDGRFCFVPDLDRSFTTLDEAMATAGRVDPTQQGIHCEIRWRPRDAPLAEDEQPCPLCAAPLARRDRYPRRLCPACQLEATDAEGRPVQFGNRTPLGAGFQARYRRDGAPYDSPECWVRGVACIAEEDKFGGIVIQPRAT